MSGGHFLGRCRACEVWFSTCQTLREHGQACCSDCAEDAAVHMWQWQEHQ